jgi:hypothetical protein
VHTGFSWGDLMERGNRRRLEDNIKVDVQEVEWGGVGWICLA